ncbi:MAG: DUF2075 domain-containing protein [Lachnospiraceae bacterium]|nr:DUF2075 domain-containing protein [Lachnospiraceae bacterium]
MKSPIIYTKPETISSAFADAVYDEIVKRGDPDKTVLLNYPTVYIHYWNKDLSDPDSKYDIYIGESNDVIERTKQHYYDSSNPKNWQYDLSRSGATPNLVIIGHDHFNKSLTLDIENRMIQYALGMSTVENVRNGRGNPQNSYYPDVELDELFSKIWRQLRRYDKRFFLTEAEIKDSAIFKASPFHKLTDEQIKAQNLITDTVRNALSRFSAMGAVAAQNHQLVFVEGEAGTGKTVLTNSTFYKLIDEGYKCQLLVNHEEQVSVYKEIARKLQLPDYEKIVSRPTTFINNQSITEPIDVAFIDEAHLLWTQGKQTYRGNNQLDDIMARAKVTVIMFDEYQILTTEEYWEPAQIINKRVLSQSQGNYLTLTNQLRMHAGNEIMDWIDAITKRFTVDKLVSNPSGYDLQIFDSPDDLDKAIRKKANEPDKKLSRIVASYDWDYSDRNTPHTGKPYWGVNIGDSFFKPWNRELLKSTLANMKKRSEKQSLRKLAWAEQPQTIDEIGSTFTIQGFDLVYAGVIIGPSVKYRNGKIEFHPECSKNDKAIRNRTLSDGTKRKFAEYLLSHELRVLLTRGVKGMYIYACDDELRNALKDSLI